MNLEEAYEVMQKAWVELYNVEVGDIVRVLRIFETHELGCNAVWVDHKNLIGQEFKVVNTNTAARRIVLDIQFNTCYDHFPFFCLEFVKKAEPVIEIDVKINGVTSKLSDISRETLLKIRNKG